MELRRRITLILPVLAITLQAASTLHSDSGEVDQAAQRLLNAGAAGLSMALIDGSGMTWSGSRGYADIAAQIPMSTDTVLNIASISKTVTATSLMLLVEQGKLDLDRDINSYLPFTVVNTQHPEEIVTTRQLLTHTSAIIDRQDLYFSATSYYPEADNPLSLGEFLQAYLSPDGKYYEAGNFASYPPGTKQQYSNIGFGLAGYLVEGLSGVPLNRFSAQHIFKPLGMDASGWMLTEIDSRRHAKLYEWNGEEQVPVEWYGLATWPDGGLRTSVRDLARFYAAVIGGGQFQETRILAKESVETMFALQFAPGQVLAAVQEDESHQQALAWSYHRVKAGKMVLGHGGGDPGVATDAQFFPQAGVGAILLVNTSAETDEFRQAFENLMETLLEKAVEGVE
jgi:CubicO group peptidase (beta-lactamase class C family)